MKYQEFIAIKKFELMPEAEKKNIRKEYANTYLSKDIENMGADEAGQYLDMAKQKMLETEASFVNANQGPQISADDLTGKEKELYQQKITEGMQQEAKEGNNNNTFTDFVDKYTTAAGKRLKDPWKIASLFSPYGLGLAMVEGITIPAFEARKQQAQEYMQATGEKTVSGTDFPLALVGEGVLHSGPVRLAKTFLDQPKTNNSSLSVDPKSFEPELNPSDRFGKVLYGLGSIAPELPIFMTGPIKGFAASKMISSYADAREKMIQTGNDISFDDVKNVIIEGGKGAVTGKLLGVGSKLPTFVTKSLGQSLTNNLLSKGMSGAAGIAERMVVGLENVLSTGVDATVLTAADTIMNSVMPTTDAQKQGTWSDGFTLDNIIDGAIMIGLLKVGNKLAAPIADPLTNELTTKIDTAKNIKMSQESIEQFFSKGDVDINTKLFQNKLKKDMTPGQIRELSEVTGKPIQEIMNSTPKEFTEIGREYQKHISELIGKTTVETFIDMDKSLAGTQAEQVRDAITKEITSQSKVTDTKTPGYGIAEDVIGRIYGEGEVFPGRSTAMVKDTLVGKNYIINKGVENGSMPEVVKGRTPRIVDPSTGIDMGSMKVSPLPVSKAEVDMMKTITNFTDAPVTGRFLTASKRIQHLGPKYKEAFVDIFRDTRSAASKDANVEKDYARKFFSELNLSAKERDNVWRKMTSEQMTGKETLKRMGELEKLPEKLTEREQKMYDFMHEKYQSYAAMHNDARILSGLDPMNTAMNYMPLMRKFTWSERAGLKNKGNVPSEEIFFNEMLSKDQASFSKAREFTDRAIEKDIQETYLKYVDAFYSSTYEMPVLAKMKKMINPMETTSGEKIWIKETAPNTYEYLKKYIEYLEGVPQYENTLYNNLIKKVSKNLGRSIIGGNLRSVASQAAAGWGMLTEMPMNSLKVADKLLDPAAWKEAFSKSRVLADRVVDASYTDTVGSPLHSVKDLVKHPIDSMTKALFAPMRLIDITFATWSWHASYDFAKSKGMGEVEAVRFADQKTVDWNASAAKEDISEIQRTPLGKAMTLFQTHPINQINWIGRDLVGIKFVEKAYEGSKIRPKGTKRSLDFSESFLKDPMKAVKLINLIATGTGIAYIYQNKLGMYSPIPSPALAFFGVDEKGQEIPKEKAFIKAFSEFLSFFPVGSTAEWGGSGVFGAQFSQIYNWADSLAGMMNDKKKRIGAKDFYQQTAIMIGVPGAKQVIREYKKFEKEMKGIEDMKDPKKRERAYNAGYNKIFKEVKKYYKPPKGSGYE